MRIIKIITCNLIFGILLISCHSIRKQEFVVQNIEFAEHQIENTIGELENCNKIPRTISEDNKLKTVNIYSWTSGFFAGNLWYLYDLTRDEKWKNEAIRWTEVLDTIQYWSGNHDVGFMIGDSYGLGLKMANKEEYKSVIIQTAESLCKRYNKNTKCIESWDYRKAWDGKTEWYFPVIIDNMMNLELLFEASKLSGDIKYAEIAIQHANTTLKNHYRPDYSCYHVVDYDTITGNILDKATCQGFTDDSAWARGQAWGFYGYVSCYRYTKHKPFLDFAENIAGFLLEHPGLPKDKIPYWDYNIFDTDKTPEWPYDGKKEIAYRDVSAAAIISSALFELAQITKSPYYFESAKSILLNLSENYKSKNNSYFILEQSVGSYPHGTEINVPLVYADYYFLEALCRYRDFNVDIFN